MALKKLKRYTIKIFEWFHNNHLKSNARKCNLIASSTSLEEIRIENTIISSINRVKLLGVHIDGRLDFGYHVSQICKRASKKYTLYLGYANIWIKIYKHTHTQIYIYIYTHTHTHTHIYNIYVAILLLPFSVDVAQQKH